MFGIMNNLKVVICEDASDAVAKGHVYDTGYSPIEVHQVVVVKNGTTAGNPSVEFVMVDQSGNKFVVMLTGRLLKSIPC